MAMIKCPNCGEEISEKARRCVHCGAEIPAVTPEPTVLLCEECGAVLTEADEVCPKCGCPVQKAPEPEEKPQKVEVTNVRIPVDKKARKAIITVVVIVLVAVAAFAVARVGMKSSASKEYAQKLETAVYTMLDGASTAETEATLIHDVWYNTIYEEDSTRTDKYTKSNGVFHDDFNTSLLLLMVSDDYTQATESIESNQETVRGLMKELQNPPEEYADAYDALKEYYDAYLELTNLALDPSGNLSSYTSSLNEADTNTANCYKAMQLYLDD